MLPNVTQSFKLQRPYLESCRAEAMLRLCIADRCSTQLYKTCNHLKELVCVWELCVIQRENCVSYKKRGKLQLRCSKSQCWQIKNVDKKVYWPRPAFSAHAYWERVQDEKL